MRGSPPNAHPSRLSRPACTDSDEVYARHTGVTRPGPHADLLRALPADVHELVPLVQTVLVHFSRAGDFTPGAGRPDDGTELRGVRELLDAVVRLDDRPWWALGRPRHRLIVDCRANAVLTCAVLREHGVPARVRFGFADYLVPGHAQSHVICEYADTTGSWARVDPDTGLSNPGGFTDPGSAWRLDDDAVSQFGYAPDEAMRGRWTVRFELQRDLAALTGFEPMTSDQWGAMLDPSVDADGGHRDLFDRIAAATTLSERRALAADPTVAVPRVIEAVPYLTGRRYPVDLVAEGVLDA